MSTPPQSSAAHREPGVRDAAFSDLAMDLCRFGPAPNRSRELFVVVATATGLAVLFAVLTPTSPVMMCVAVAAAAYLAVRWVVGVRCTWRSR